MIDSKVVIEATRQRFVLVRRANVHNFTPVTWETLKIAIDAIVDTVNAELESRVANCDTQLLERAMCVIADELQRRGV
jgi:hypothetical protein